MVQPRILISTMRTYKIGALEAQWLLNAKAEHYKLLSTGQVIKPYQPI